VSLDGPVRDGVTIEGGSIVRRRDGVTEALMPVTAVKVPGRHLLTDVLAATAVSCLVGVPAAAMQRALESFEGLAHALERVATIRGVQYINDSKATNIASATKAIESFERGLVVILGGKYKGGDFADLAAPLRARGASVVAIGEAAPRIHAALDGVVPVQDATTMDAAVRLAAGLAPEGGTVLLAPACSSFDMFRDYTERGRAFTAAVQGLAM
jgi:UDP-N-acetylmuramoylalanine--D-glutamate ligase